MLLPATACTRAPEAVSWFPRTLESRPGWSTQLLVSEVCLRSPSAPSPAAYPALPHRLALGYGPLSTTRFSRLTPQTDDRTPFLHPRLLLIFGSP